MADPIFSPHDTIDYFARLTAAHGATAGDFSRLFLVPGMAHCAGGAATDSMNALSSLVDWVESGKAPARIEAKGTAVYPNRSRPLCPYPQYAQYNGSGDSEAATNYTCQ
jgi:feruloyl esterase